MIEKENAPVPKGNRKIRRGTTTSDKVKRLRNVPLYRTSGNVTMTQNATYRFPNPYGAKQITFFGVAVKYSGASAAIRVDLFGMAQLAPSYYFTPQDSTSVGLAGPKQKIIQAGKFFLVVDENVISSSPEYRARSTETTIINVDWPNTSTIVARAEVVDYGPDYFDVEVTLATDWEIYGNFMCT